ncbi:MAG: hypothetical protein HQM15_06430 [Deltaproteobacteria bacterium]|nr:hypothetical protein [Deltaproteobacteria bacterium]
MKSRFKIQKGFSALEAIFAIMILSVGFIGYMTLFSQMAKTTETDDMRLRAGHLAGEKMEDLIATKAISGYAGINTGTTTENISYDSYNFTRRTQIQFVDSSDLRTVSALDTGYKSVNVSVSWNYGGLLSVQMMSLISNY